MTAKNTMTFIGEPDMNRIFQALSLLIGANAGVELTVKSVRKKAPAELLKETSAGRVALLEVK